MEDQIVTDGIDELFEEIRKREKIQRCNREVAKALTSFARRQLRTNSVTAILPWGDDEYPPCNENWHLSSILGCNKIDTPRVAAVIPFRLNEGIEIRTIQVVDETAMKEPREQQRASNR